MSTYSENKQQLLTLARTRRADGFAPKECPDSGLVRTMISELRRDGYEFVTFRLPEAAEAHYALAEYVGTKHDGYAALRARHPEAFVKNDDRLPRQRRTDAERFEPSPAAEHSRRDAKTRAQRYRRGGNAGGDLDIYLRGRRRLLESIENVTSIPHLVMSVQVPPDDIASLLEDLTDLRAYADVLISYIQGKVDDAAFADRLVKLRNVEGRPPEEAKAFLETADRLEREREKRLQA